MSDPSDGHPLLRVRDLNVSYQTSSGGLFGKADSFRAVSNASFSVRRGQTVGLVGESGSGKSTIGKAILKLIPSESGKIEYDGVDIAPLSESAFLPFRKRIQTIFQDPYASLNPRLTVGAIIAEPLIVHESQLSRSDREARVVELLEKVGLPSDAMRRYPHQFSGGQRQRICIARALSSRPEFIICDECVSALDVSVQAQIVNLLQDLQDEFAITYLFIAHDLAVVEHMSHEVVVMQNGKIVEQGTSESIYNNPQSEYTKKLLAAVPAMPSIAS
ncbi:ABC transporter ATP-binding protein [Pelagicoccus sp. NFK12]|uniref:ABC transporter ATP-binding protein n=1 Tax=Pelagicoccus enzymogenes TaxID=2773457 RepID=A0A927F4W4_9BACT|nr:ATP-binding cassette domain-containing protein [Pelagicoccus enzymogenes]MBD5778487.1 ABC transporter ATP-binding protein [Pelagicoccus enzymogenes]MDQ8197152.1 ATP-binding cassette domain-containing protein [Pelagicoccus enzymogenes]